MVNAPLYRESDRAPKPRQKPILNWKQLTERLRDWIAHRQELRIWRTKTHDGSYLWSVYDPLSDRTYHFERETDIRTWLEEHRSRKAWKNRQELLNWDMPFCHTQR
ncbi:hypothetical protein [Geitlerinema sp. PCC 9228]|jgi:hypothetical protein|uniref:hypothetical protein n=1 Tax=Geitlerinema sp. PCC 9228 TaxID=111611 RepID=UPI0008F9B7BB|nr:hypothetical protein [Geitlerinema sp. PCC 9228]